MSSETSKEQRASQATLEDLSPEQKKLVTKIKVKLSISLVLLIVILSLAYEYVETSMKLYP